MASFELSDQDFLRYARQLSLPWMTEEKQVHLLQSQVCIVGCGGLAATAASYLVAAGVGVRLIDDDCVELSNLQRQIQFSTQDAERSVSKAQALADRLNDINPTALIQAITQRFSDLNGYELLSGASMILDCTDNFQTRQTLNQMAKARHIPFVSAASIGDDGQLCAFNYEGADASCYRCWVEINSSAASFSCQQGAVLGPTVGMMGTLQAQWAIKALAGVDLPWNRLMRWQGGQFAWQSFRIVKNPMCEVCSVSKQQE